MIKRAARPIGPSETEIFELARERAKDVNGTDMMVLVEVAQTCLNCFGSGISDMRIAKMLILLCSVLKDEIRGYIMPTGPLYSLSATLGKIATIMNQHERNLDYKTAAKLLIQELIATSDDRIALMEAVRVVKL